MGYFNYHAKVKKLISQGELCCYEIVESYHNIAPCMILFFKSHPPMPIREHRFQEYLDIINTLDIPYKKK